MKTFRTLIKSKPKKFKSIVEKKIKATRKSGQINLLTGKPIKRKPKKIIEETSKVVITESSYAKKVVIINTIPSNLIDVIPTFPKELQQFLNNTNILSVKNTAGMIMLTLEGDFEVIVKDTTVNNRPKKLVILKQGKKQILKTTI